MAPDSDRRDSDSLSPETRREIERQFDEAAQHTQRLASAFLHYLIRALAAVVILTALAFSFDYIYFIRSPNALGSVLINRYYAVTLKNKKTEFTNADPEIQTCVNSVFPHSGYYPCWYLRRHNVREIDI
jgi:hypothetical protein